MNLNTQKWDRLAVPFLGHAQLSKRTEEKHFHGPVFGTIWRYQKWDVSTKFNCFLARWFDGFNPFACFTEEYPTTSSFVNDLNNWVCSSSCHGFELQDCKFFVFNRPYSCSELGVVTSYSTNDWFRSDEDWSDFSNKQKMTTAFILSWIAWWKNSLVPRCLFTRTGAPSQAAHIHKGDR